MVAKLIMQHVTEWIEVGVVLTGLFIAAIASASITLYKVDMMRDDLEQIRESLVGVPVLIERMESLEEDMNELEDDFRIVEQRRWEKHSG